MRLAQELAELIWLDVIKEIVIKRSINETQDITVVYCDIIEKRNTN